MEKKNKLWWKVAFIHRSGPRFGMLCVAVVLTSSVLGSVRHVWVFWSEGCFQTHTHTHTHTHKAQVWIWWAKQTRWLWLCSWEVRRIASASFIYLSNAKPKLVGCQSLSTDKSVPGKHEVPVVSHCHSGSVLWIVSCSVAVNLACSEMNLAEAALMIKCWCSFKV